jgi:hypothetical protein
VGAWVVDQQTGERSQIEALLPDGSVQLRRGDGTSIRVQLRPGDPNAAEGKLPAN